MSIRARSGNGRAVRAPETIVQDQRAWELKCLHYTDRQIAVELGIAPTTAMESWKRGAAMMPTPNMIEERQAMLDELDRVSFHLYGVMTREHVKVDHGHVVSADDGTLILDDGPGVQAAMGLLRTQERRSHLLGLDAPARTRIDYYPHDKFAEDFERLEREVAELEQNGGDRSDAGGVEAVPGTTAPS